MKKIALLSSLIIPSVCSLGLLATTLVKAQPNNTSWYLSTNPVPVTNGVSEQFHQSLINSKPPVLDVTGDSVPKTAQAFRALMAERDKASAVTAQQVSKTLNTTINKDAVAGVNVYWVTPKKTAPEYKDKLFVYIHGGAFVYNGGLASTLEASIIATTMGIPTVAIDYRKGPDFPAPAATNDITAVWQKLLSTRKTSSMVMGGSSAGAALTMTSVQNFNTEGLAVPSALYLGTPAAEVAMQGDSRFINEGIDRNLGAWRGATEKTVAIYVGDNDPKSPIVSPIYGSFDNFPPTYLISGTRDLMLSDTVRVHRSLRRAGVEADLHIYEGQSHADYMAAMQTPESKEHYQELATFMAKHLL